MSDRTPHDGRPYYCALCGCGFAEFLACELPDCELESAQDAQARRRGDRRRKSLKSGQPGDTKSSDASIHDGLREEPRGFKKGDPRAVQAGKKRWAK